MCTLSPLLFNIYLDYLLRRHNDGIPSGIKLNNCNALNMLLADNMYVIHANENALQKSLYGLQHISKEYNLNISP